MEKISAVYKIVNTITNDCYIGSSKDVMLRWMQHKRPSVWEKCPNSQLYQDFQKYGLDKFRFQVLAPVMPEYLKQVEQEFIDLLHPTYNSKRANGLDAERRKETYKKARGKYNKSEKGRKATREYNKSEKGKKAIREYLNQPCVYNGKTLTLDALRKRFYKAGIEHPTKEAKKYLLCQ